MSRIVAGRFDTMPSAQHAVQALRAAGCAEDEISVFFNAPPGQHGKLPIGGDEHADPEARGAASRTVTGAAIGAGVGLVAGSLAGGPMGAAAGAAVGGYTGSLAGTLAGLGNEGEDERRRPGGVMVAVKVSGAVSETKLVRILEQTGAKPVEAQDGEWRDGQWIDFDPVRAMGGGGVLTDEPPVYRIVPGGNGNWSVFDGNLGKLLSDFPDREEAVDYATALAAGKDHALVEIYRAGGVLESTRSLGRRVPRTSGTQPDTR